MNLLEWMNRKAEAEKRGVTKADVKRIMECGDDSEKEELWKKVNELGGYDALYDGGDLI